VGTTNIQHLDTPPPKNTGYFGCNSSLAEKNIYSQLRSSPVLGGCLNFLKTKTRSGGSSDVSESKNPTLVPILRGKKNRIKEETTTGSSYFKNLKELTDCFS
jgi:hypothetical protein